MAEFKASSVEEAIRQGLEELGLTREQAVVEVLDNGGFLKKARVSVLPRQEATACDTVLTFVREIGRFLDADCEFSAAETEERITVLISGEDSGKLIGYRGDVLDAIQYIASVILNKEHKDYKRVTIDCENYREKREEILKKLASRLADKAVRTARKVKLEPMNPAERRVIHAALQSNEEVETVSVGAEPNRYLTIVPKNMKKERRGGRDRRPYQDRNRTGSREGGAGESDAAGMRAPREGGEHRPYNREGGSGERRPFNREGGSGERRPYNREGGGERRPYNREGGRDGRRPEGRSGGGRGPAPKKSFLGFGSYLGNTKSSLEREILEERKQAFRENKYVEPPEEAEQPDTPAAEEHTEE